MVVKRNPLCINCKFLGDPILRPSMGLRVCRQKKGRFVPLTFTCEKHEFGNPKLGFVTLTEIFRVLWSINDGTAGGRIIERAADHLGVE